MEWEDLDLCWRAWARGWASVYVPEARLRHRVGAVTTASVSARRLASSHHNLVRFALKCLPAAGGGPRRRRRAAPAAARIRERSRPHSAAWRPRRRRSSRAGAKVPGKRELLRTLSGPFVELSCVDTAFAAEPLSRDRPVRPPGATSLGSFGRSRRSSSSSSTRTRRSATSGRSRSRSALFGMLYIVFGRFFKLGGIPHYYPLYLLLGIVLWTFFADATTLGMFSLVARESLLRKLAFPRIVIPISATLTAAITFAREPGRSRRLHRVRTGSCRGRSWLLIVPLLARAVHLHARASSLILATLFVRLRDLGQVWELVAPAVVLRIADHLPGRLPASVVAGRSRSSTRSCRCSQDIRAIVIYPDLAEHDHGHRRLRDALGASSIPLSIALGVFVVGVRALPPRGAVVRGAGLMAAAPRSRSLGVSKTSGSRTSTGRRSRSTSSTRSTGRRTSSKTRSTTSASRSSAASSSGSSARTAAARARS